MKISQIYQQKKCVFSMEFFPPKTEEAMSDLFQTIAESKKLKPDFISVTYGAGGGTRDKTLQIVRRAKQELGIETMAHLTCVGHSQKDLEHILTQLQESKIENVIALRGDPPKGESQFKTHPDGFTHAVELVKLIRKSFPFCVAVAGYPEGHPETPSREKNWEHLAEKIRAGGEVIMTQLFFDNQDFFNFSQWLKNKGISVPVVAGIMPITNYSQIVRFAQMCGAKIPLTISQTLTPIQNDLEAVQNFGIEYAIQQCSELIENGVRGIHFYTLNRSRSSHAILNALHKKFPHLF